MLNLIPEGMIVNLGTGQRFYIVHVEGDEINLFNIMTFLWCVVTDPLPPANLYASRR